MDGGTLPCCSACKGRIRLGKLTTCLTGLSPLLTHCAHAVLLPSCTMGYFVLFFRADGCIYHTDCGNGFFASMNMTHFFGRIKIYVCFFISLTTPWTCRSSWTRDRALTTAVSQTTAVTVQGPQPTEPPGNSKIFFLLMQNS